MRIVDANYGLLRKYVKLFTGSASREDAKDFEAAGRLGLMRAIDNYDPYRGSFAQWAFKPIQREVLRAVHSADHNNMNPGDFERRPEILRALKKLQGENDEVKPTEAQVAVEAESPSSRSSACYTHHGWIRCTPRWVMETARCCLTSSRTRIA